MTKIHLQSTYSDIVSDGGLDPRNEYEKKFKQKPLTEDDDLNNVRYKAKYRYETKQPLTREQMEKIYYSVLLNTENFWWDFARAIERAHGIGVENEPDQRST